MAKNTRTTRAARVSTPAPSKLPGLPSLPTPRAPTPPPPPAGLGRSKQSVSVRRQPSRRFGPKALKLFAAKVLRTDWCAPPDTWTASNTERHSSNSEYMVYRAIWRVKNMSGDPDQPPFDGREGFDTQAPLLGGRLGPGGSVCDFLVPFGTKQVCIRLQSERWHVQAGNLERMRDARIKANPPQGVQMVDVYEQDFVGDCTGESACRVVARALRGEDAPNPATLGTSRRVR